MDDTILSLGGTASLYRDTGADYPNYSNNIRTWEQRYKMDPSGGIPPVPVPAAVWLFGTALIGLFGFGKRRKAA